MKCVTHIFLYYQSTYLTLMLCSLAFCPDLNKKCRNWYMSQIHPPSKLFRATATMKCACIPALV